MPIRLVAVVMSLYVESRSKLKTVAVLTAESKDEVTDVFNSWKAEMEQGGLKLNMEKTKSMVTGNKARERLQSGRWPCGCCGRGVGANSVLCTECNKCIIPELPHAHFCVNWASYV